MMHVVHLAQLDLNLLVFLEALLRTASIKRAAAEVALSPSAMSHALARLRDLLDDDLLTRAGKAMVLTPRAEQLRVELTPLLQGLERALAPTEAPDPQTLRGAFRMVTTDYVELEIVAALSQTLAVAAPLVDVYSIKHDNEVEQLRSGDADVAVGVIHDVPDDIEKQTLFHDRFVCLMRADHPAAQKTLTLKRYCELEHLLVAPRGTPVGVVDRMLAESGRSRRVARTVASFLVAPHLVARSDYVLTVAERVAQRFGDWLELASYDVPLPLEGFTVSMVWHRRNDRDPRQAWFRSAVAAAAASTASPIRASRRSPPGRTTSKRAASGAAG